jgi:SAM-dependent methyltransferase
MTLPLPAPHDHFEALYADSDDPWRVRDSWYEQRKRALLLAALDRPRYSNAFEPGCGNGEMSVALAARCDTLLACDGSASAVAAARRCTSGIAGCAIQIDQRRLPEQWPADQSFDLIVISELAYYFDTAGVAALAAAAHASLSEGGLLVLCHWRPDFADRASPTAQVHAAFAASPLLRRRVHHLDEAFLLESWQCQRDVQAVPA